MRIRLLGSIELLDDDGTPVDLRSPSLRRLLAALTVQRGAVVPAERLADILGVSVGALRTSVSRLRRLTGERLIATSADGYALESADVDARRFETLYAQARGLATNGGAVLNEALSLWRGDALAEFAAEEWAQAEAVRLNEMRADAFEDRLDAMVSSGRFGEAVAELQPHIAAHPLRERPRGLLMRALAAQGRQVEALRSFQAYREYVGDEVGTEPSDELRNLDARIATGWRDVGERHSASASRSGVMTFLFTGIEGSTGRWEREPDNMRQALAEHDRALHGAIGRHGGSIFKHTGDGLCAVFSTPRGALDAAVEAQRCLVLPVRMGVATGEAEQRDGDFFGPILNRVARIMAAGHGGQVLVASATAALVAGFDLVDLGIHRLRDLVDPVDLFQLHADGLASEFPALRTTERHRGNLPRAASSFVGRQRELEAVRTALSEHRLVTIIGVGGMGKTRLALEAAATLDELPDGAWLVELGGVNDPDQVSVAAAAALGIKADHSDAATQALTGGVGKTRLAVGVAASVPWARDGVWLVELGTVRDADEVPTAVAAAIGIRPVPGLALVELIAQWCSSNRALVLLDNCEHVLGGVAALVEAVLRRPTTTVLLATSREALSVAGERVIALGSLPLPRQPGDTTDAVRLFVARAQDEAPGFDANTDIAAVAEICVRLDGIPLAIELAAARMRALTPRQVADRLDERFRLLTGGRRTAVERHKTLRATVEWSYDLLDAQHKLVFDRLSVFAATFGLDDAVGLCASAGLDEWAVIDFLTALVDRSLVTRTPEHRYRMLETLRSYGSERLEVTGTSDALRGAHAEWFRSKAAAVRGRTIGPHEHEELAGFIAQLPEYDAAVAWAFNHGDHELGIDIVFFAFEALYISQMRPMQAIGSFVEWMTTTAWNEPDLGYAPPLPFRSLVRALTVASAWFSAIEVNHVESTRLARCVIEADPDESWGYSLLAVSSRLNLSGVDAAEVSRAAVAAAGKDIPRLAWAYYSAALLGLRAGPDDAARATATAFQDWAVSSRSDIAVANAATVMVLLEWSKNPVLALAHADAGLRVARATLARSSEHMLDALRIRLLIDLSLPDAQSSTYEVLDKCRQSGDHQLLLLFLACTTVVLQRVGNIEAAARVAGQVDRPLQRPMIRQFPLFASMFDDAVATLKTGLGAEFDKHYQEGARMDVTDLIELAIAALVPLAKTRIDNVTQTAERTPVA